MSTVGTQSSKEHVEQHMSTQDHPNPYAEQHPSTLAGQATFYNRVTAQENSTNHENSSANLPEASGSGSTQNLDLSTSISASTADFHQPTERSSHGTAAAIPQTTQPTCTSSSDTLTAEVGTDAIQPAPQTNKYRDSNGSSIDTSASDDRQDAEQGAFLPIKSATQQTRRPGMIKRKSVNSEDDLFRALSQRRTSYSDVDPNEEKDEVERLMSRMFGKERQKHSEEEKTRHSGVVFRDLTVKGVGLGASLQPTVSDIFMNLPRFLKNLFTKGINAAIGKPPTRELLTDFNGCVRPGELLLVLGRPGSGCSTFLKVFCNQRAGYKEVLGDVTYGGTDAKRMAKDFRGEIIYQPEDDLHYATLTVKQTLNFALKTRTPGKESRLEGESRKDYVAEFMRVALKLLWIEHTVDTKVGNEYVRGVSGGERKRVSIAEALITRASVQGWDNSSKGLDASTAVEYVQSLRTLTNMAGVSTAVSLYQAGESLYNLVDKVLLIDQGQCLYFGSSDDAKQYFMDLGFDCPNRWTTADFLTSVTDEHERSVRKGWEDRIPRSAQDFADAYRKSDIYEKNLDDMKDFEAQLESQRRSRLEVRSKKNEKKNFTIPYHQQVFACTKRQYLVMLGDRATLISKWGGIVFQGLIVGSLFFQIPSTTAGAFTKGGVLFLILLFNALLALAEQTAAFESKPILMKHKQYCFNHPSAYALAQTVVDIPLVLIQSQLSGTLDDATKITGIGIQVLIVYTGYLIPPSSMPPWFAWLRRINWIQYGFECLMANEFYTSQMECVPPYLVPQGPNASRQYQACTLAGSTVGSTTVNGARYIEASFGYTRNHLWRNFGILWVFFFVFLALTCLGMERMKPNSGGGAVTMFKRGQVPKKMEESIETGGRSKANDEEKLNEKSVTPEQGITSSVTEDSISDDDVLKQVAKNETIFTFQDINYTIPYQGSERKLLQKVQGVVKPGKLTALMGASGAGKTTLLNTLAQRINFGTVSGTFLVDGRPLPRSFQRATGFAEQMDVHEPTATVREALQFSALLRQPREVSVTEKYAYCETIIDLLEMRDIAGATIGRIGEGLNAEQRKRLTIGVELASKPELLFFLDEPTSGLDSGAAFNIIRFLRKLADAGQAVLCTIHQPSAVLFEHFDDLILLKSGGRVVYAGELGKDSSQLRTYFENNGATKCPPSANPAEWMLEVIGAGNPDYDGPDYGDIWLKSDHYKEQTKELEALIEERKHVEHSSNIRDDREYAMPVSTQTIAVVKRTFVAYWRTPNYGMGVFFLHILTGLFNCFTFYHLGYASIDFQSRLFSVFMTLVIAPPLIQQLQPIFLTSRKIFESRENNARIYSWFAWTTAAVIVEIPYRVVAGSVYFCCWWWGPMGYRTSSFASGFMFMLVMMLEIYYTSLGQAIAAFSPNDLFASILVPLFFLFIISFCGVVVPPQGIPKFWRDWMYWTTPFHYLLEAMLGVAVHDLPVVCKPNEFARFTAPPGQTCQSYTESFIRQAGGYVQTGADGICEFCQYATGDEFGRTFSVYYSHRWRDFVIFFGFIIFNYLVIYFATYLRFKGKNPFKEPIRKLLEKRKGEF